MVGTASLAAVLGAGLAAAAASAVGTTTDTPTQSPFGGRAAVHIAHVGRIDVDLAPGVGVLIRVPCVGSAPGTACYLAPRPVAAPPPL